MSVELALIAASFGIAAAVGAVHFYDRFHPRGLYRATLGRADAGRSELTRAADSIGALRVDMTTLASTLTSPDVVPALNALSERLGALQSILGTATELMPPNLPPEVTGAIGGNISATKAQRAKVAELMGQDMMGVYGGILQQYLPTLYDWIVEDPSRLMQVLEMPIVRKVLGQATQFVGKVTGKVGTGSEGGSGGIDWSRVP